MTSKEKFEKWFELTFPKHIYPDGESRDEIETYLWLAWGDSRRDMGEEACATKMSWSGKSLSAGWMRIHTTSSATRWDCMKLGISVIFARW